MYEAFCLTRGNVNDEKCQKTKGYALTLSLLAIHDSTYSPKYPCLVHLPLIAFEKYEGKIHERF